MMLMEYKNRKKFVHVRLKYDTEVFFLLFALPFIGMKF